MGLMAPGPKGLYIPGETRGIAYIDDDPMGVPGALLIMGGPEVHGDSAGEPGTALGVPGVEWGRGIFGGVIATMPRCGKHDEIVAHSCSTRTYRSCLAGAAKSTEWLEMGNSGDGWDDEASVPVVVQTDWGSSDSTNARILRKHPCTLSHSNRVDSVAR